MILLWVTGDSLAQPDILAGEGDFQTHPSEAQCLCFSPNRRLNLYWACSVFATVASILQQHSETSHYHTQWRHLNILWTRCAEIDWAEDICPVLSTLFTPISRGWAHLCWQRTRWEIVIRSVLLRFNYFYPRCEFSGAGMTSLLHFHVESFIHRRAGGWPPPKFVPCTHQLHNHCSCWLSPRQIWNETIWTGVRMCTRWHFLKETFKC